MTTSTDISEKVAFLIRHADDNLIMAQRLGEYISRAPDLEQDIAVANIGLDHIGVAMHLYDYAAELEGGDATSDRYAMQRTEREYTNVLLVEQPQPDFGHLIARSFFFDVYQTLLWGHLAESDDETLAGIAERALREATYHLRHSTAWVVRLGDGTHESHERMQAAIDAMWRFTGELFDVSDDFGPNMADDHDAFLNAVADVFEEATLVIPADPYQATGGRSGRHSEHLGHMLSEMQWMQRSYPGASW
jgi:ring-1,2-phenylacetyl-CoA epoxidase subunit PaaC